LPLAFNTQRAVCGDVRLDRFDDAIADADIAPAAELLARVEDVAALDDEVELVLRAHRGLHRTSHEAGCAERRYGADAGEEELAAIA
jgi:hypothetical protein